jgi:hypothetical protein
MKSRPVRFAHIAAISALLSVVGCATTLSSVNELNPYPPSWPPIDSRIDDLGCPILQGNYDNQSAQDSAGSGYYISRLAEVIERAAAAGQRIWPKSQHVTIPQKILAVSLVQEQDLLSLKFHEPSGNSTTVHLRRFRLTSELEFEHIQKFYCENMPEGPVLRLMATVDRAAGASLLGAGGQDTIIWLYKAVDGSLIVRWQLQTVETTLLLIGSSLEKRSIWLRFKPVDLATIGVP